MHNWDRTQKYGYATIYKCTRCGAGRHYEWDPGWPGWTTYFDAQGAKVEEEPQCVELPTAEELTRAAGDFDNWQVAEGFQWPA